MHLHLLLNYIHHLTSFFFRIVSLNNAKNRQPTMILFLCHYFLALGYRREIICHNFHNKFLILTLQKTQDLSKNQNHYENAFISLCVEITGCVWTLSPPFLLKLVQTLSICTCSLIRFQLSSSLQSLETINKNVVSLCFIVCENIAASIDT